LWWLISGRPLLPPIDAGIIILTGIITIFSIVIYFKALSIQETSVVILLFQLSPLFTLLLSVLFLRESLTPQQYIGFVLILAATILIALPREKNTWAFPKGFWLIVLYDAMFAIIGILLKYSSSESSFNQIIAFESFGMGLGGILIYIFIPTIRNAFLKSRKMLFKKALPVIVLNEILFVLAKSLGYYAFILGPVTLVSVLSNVQVFFGLLFGWILTILIPHTFHEDISKKGLALKAGTAFLLFVGLYFMI
jgi:drug/metabolite transporter (DMT)-like permease